MSINEFSVGPFYFAFARSNTRKFPPHLVDITEMCEPYRVGKALLCPTGLLWCVCVGLWHRDIYDDVIEDFPGDWPEEWRHIEYDDPSHSPGWLQGRALTRKELDALSEEDPSGTEDP